MKKSYFLLVLSLLIGCYATPAQMGDDAYQSEKYDKAISHYDKALKDDPSNYPILLKQASAYEHAGQVDLALAAYSSLIQKYPKEAMPRLYRARLLFKSNDDLTALKDVDRLFSGYKISGEIQILAYSLQGEIYYNQDDPKKSMEAFESALMEGEKRPDFKATYHYRRILYNAGRVAFALGNFRQSKEYFQKYLERKKLNGIAIDEGDNYFYALVLKYNGDFEEAEKYEANLSPESRGRLAKEATK